jgi:prepilin-type N-terminal cleavage/methylation domain-containing protein
MSPVRELGRRARGFTLLEVLVALIIFAIAFGVLAQIIQTGLGQAHSAAATSEATLLARSLLAEVGSELPVSPGVVEGEAAGGYRWRIEMRATEDGADDALSAYLVQVTVAWGPEARSVELSTLRLGAAPP